MMRKRFLRIIAVTLCTVALVTCGIFGTNPIVSIEEDETPLGSFISPIVSQTDDDLNIIPDKYNTGAKGELEKVLLGDVVEGIQLKGDGSGTKNVMDFYKRNITVSGDVTIENKDFSPYDLAVYSENEVERKIKITFKNCSFAKISKGKENPNVYFEFENCTMNNFNGSNATFNNCYIGHSYSDGLVPYQNVVLNNCFFGDLVDTDCEGSGYHTDGTQLYGYKGVDVQNVTYNNCRFEIPAISCGAYSAAVNSCLMMQLEYSNGKDISVKNCIMNGGGYTIFARSVKEEFSLSNVVLDGIRIGCARTFGFFYTDVSPNVDIKNVRENTSLYVASVWKENGKTHFSVTNDTDVERCLVIYTDRGEFTFTIPACPNAKTLSSIHSYDEMPFDIDIEVPADCKYAVCYDATVEGALNQIRFVNWSNERVVLSDEFFNRLNAHRGEVVASGKCGKDVTYQLDNEGVLTLTGTGSTDDYHSQKITPWVENNYRIRKLVVKEGITRLGNQLFNGSESLDEVVLPEGLLEIGTRAFAKCSSLTEVWLPTTVESLSDTSFYGSVLRKLYCTTDQYNVFGQLTGLANMLTVPVYNTEDSEQTPEETILMTGSCGKDIIFELTESGVLRLNGEGATYNYHSLKNAPWSKYRDLIKEVVVGEGITIIGNQLFCRCPNLEKVSLPESLESIECNVFISCKKITSIYLPAGLKSIKRYSFHGTGLNKILYGGNETTWKQVIIGVFNEPIYGSTVEYNVK